MNFFSNDISEYQSNRDLQYKCYVCSKFLKFKEEYCLDHDALKEKFKLNNVILKNILKGDVEKISLKTLNDLDLLLEELL